MKPQRPASPQVQDKSTQRVYALKVVPMFDADKRSQVCPAFPDAPRSVLLPRPLPLPPHQATRTAPVGSQLAAPDKACCRPKLADRAHARAYERTSATRGMLRLRAGGNGAARAYPARAFRNGLDRAVRTPPAASLSSPSSQRCAHACGRALTLACLACAQSWMPRPLSTLSGFSCRC